MTRSRRPWQLVCLLAVAGCATSSPGTGDDAETGGTDDDGGSEIAIPTRPEEADCSDRNCGSHGTCTIIDGEPRCRCDDGYAADETIGTPCQACPSDGITDPSTETLAIDFATVSVDGTITVDGVSLAGDTTNLARIQFVGTRPGDTFDVGAVETGTYDARVVPGIYAIDFVRLNTSGLVPRNDRKRLFEAVEITNDQTIDIDIRTANFGGLVTIDGIPILDSPEDYGRLTLIDPLSKGEVPLGRTDEGAFFEKVVVGTYDLVYESSNPFGGSTPRNDRAVLQRGLKIDGDTSTDVDIRTVRLEGELSLPNAAVFEPDPFDPLPPPPELANRVTLRGLDDQGDVQLGSTVDGHYEVRVLPGRYEVTAEAQTPGLGAPSNPSGRIWAIGELRVESDQSFDVAVPAIDVWGTFTIGGIPVVDPLEYGDISLRDVHGGATIPLGPTFAPGYAVSVLPGLYDVIYSGRASGSLAPANREAVVMRDVLLDQTTRLDVDVPAVRLTGAIEINTGTEPMPMGTTGVITLADRAGSDSLFVASADAGAYAVMVVPGTYDVHYESQGEDEPAENTNHLVTADLDIMSNQTHDIVLRPVKRLFELTLDGAPATSSVGIFAYLRDDANIDELRARFVDPCCDELSLLPGTYWVEFESSYTGAPVANRRARTTCIQIPSP